MKKLIITLISSLLLITNLSATDYHIGTNQELKKIADAPWDNLQAGDRVYIHWKDTPYKEKWVISGTGTENARIEIIGVNSPNGEQAVISGNDAISPDYLNYWKEERGVIKIGGSNVPKDALPSYITIDNLEVRSAHRSYQFTDTKGNTAEYRNNAAGIYVEKAENLIIRNCTLHDNGNGLFIGANGGQTKNILIEKNHIYGNGNVGRIYEHNSYTAAIDITFQFNHYGALRDGADGNNLKDRSAGLIVRNNWIEGGNRQLDLVDAEDSEVLVNHPHYSKTYVYSNIFIEPNGAGNSQIIHYGGDSGTLKDYRKGELFLYNNTIISTREGTTSLLRLSSADETASVFNNVIYTLAGGDKLAMMSGDGIVTLHHNWISQDWVDCHCTPDGSVNDMGNNLSGILPLFEDFDNQEFRPIASSDLVNNADKIPSELIDYNIENEYEKEQRGKKRNIVDKLDIGAYEYQGASDIRQVKAEQIYLDYSKNGNIISFRNLGFKSGNYIIYNSYGEVIAKGDFHSDMSIDLSAYASGLYFIRLNESEETLVLKFIIQ